ncbi:MAG: endonuclease III [Pseudomonadota bacterium]
MQRIDVQKVLEVLKKTYAKDLSKFGKKSHPFPTIIATILSAQSTDAQVDKVMPDFLKKFPNPDKLAKAKQKDVEKIIKSVGLYKNKAKNIIAAANAIKERFAGEVPQTREDMITLPGVGRKTANVVLIKSFGQPAMPVDTHVFRVTNRIGLAKAKTPEATEEQLIKIIPEKDLGKAHFWLIYHGRRVCLARNPHCNRCEISSYCDFYRGRENGQKE